MNFSFKKKYGQNFLQNKAIIENIVNSIQPTEKDLIIEIGPGSGALTRLLKKYNANLLAYEIDTDTEEYLLSLEDEKTKIIYADFLKRDIKEDINNISFENLFIIGNLPYYITTPIITKIIEENINPKEVVIMIQKEVAERFSAKPKTREYGSITVFLNYFYEINYLFTVGKNNFYPIPNVDSAVIKLTSKEDKTPVNVSKFITFVKDSFQFKRKNLRNNLKKYDLDKISDILNENGYSLDNRAEDLPYEIFVDIVNRM